MDKKKNNDKRSYILTRETLGMTILLFCFMLTVMLLTNRAIFMGFGAAICTFMYGTFGYASYFIVFSSVGGNRFNAVFPFPFRNDRKVFNEQLRRLSFTVLL